MSIEFTCAICLDNIKELNKLKQLDCQHVFCLECINNTKEDNIIKCPLCREQTKIKNKKIKRKIKTKEIKLQPNYSDNYSENTTSFLYGYNGYNGGVMSTLNTPFRIQVTLNNNSIYMSPYILLNNLSNADIYSNGALLSDIPPQ
jgi:hypothetical protein